MQLAYLGLFSKIFNWVLNRIFEPIFKWLSNLLSTVFSWIFNEILSPILFPILEDVMWFMIDLYKNIYGTFIYTIFSGVLKIIDYMETAFDVFIGIRDVTYTPINGAPIKGSLVEILVQQESVSTIFWALTLAGLGIAMLLTIFATAKSAFDLDFENKRPVSKVLTAMMKTFIQFFMVPLFVYFMLIIATDILKVATDVLTGDVDTTLGRIVFTVASLNAAKNASMNASANPSFTLGTSYKDTSRFPFYITKTYNGPSVTVEPLDYGNIKTVNQYFNFADFDYLIGFLAAIFLLFVMAVCMITFVQRIFEIVLLYIVSPYFVSTMPLDDGERFGRWRDMFIGKCFTGFGSAIGMRLYLLVCQMIMSGQIRFTDATLGSSIEIDYFMKLFFLLGGAWAVFKSGPMVTQILSQGAGNAEAATQSTAGGALFGHTVGKAMSAGKGAMKSAFRGGAGALAARSRKAKNSDPNQKFEKSKKDRISKASTAGTWKKGTAPAGGNRSKLAMGAHRAKTAEKPKKAIAPAMRPRAKSMSELSSMKAAAAKVRRGSFSAGQKITTSLKPLDLKSAKAAPKIKPGRLAMSKDPKMMEAARAATAAAGINAAKATSQIKPGRLAMSKDPKMMEAARAATAAAGINTSASSPDTAYKRNFRFGRLLQSTYDENGNHKIRAFGVGVDRDSSGNTMAFSMKLGGLRVQRTDPNESMKLARMHIPGITRVESNVQNGQLKYSDISVLHGAVRYHSDDAGSNYRVLGGMAKATKDESGTNVRVLGGLTNVHHGQSGTDVRVMGGVTKVHHGDDGTHVRVMGGLTDVKHNETGTHVGVMGTHAHAYAEGGGGFDTFGGYVSVRANSEHLQSMKIGMLEYSRSGITKTVPQSAVFGSAPSGSTPTGSTPAGGGSTGSAHAPQSAPSQTTAGTSSASQGFSRQSAKSKVTSAKKPGNGNKPGGK